MSYFGLENIYAVIDIGTTKICVIISKVLECGKVEILGIGISPSEGLSKGMVVDVSLASNSINKAFNEAKQICNFEIENVTIGISGNHIKSYYSQGMASVKHGLIRQETIDEALNASKAISLPFDKEVLHVLPISYIIDGMTEVRNPLGMHGMRLEVTSHIITANLNAINDLIFCCSSIGLKVDNIVLEPIASAYAILNEQEKEFGALLVDIGGGTSDVAFYQKGALNYTEIILIAGKTFTNDLSICLRTSYNEAERIKKDYGINFDTLNNDFISILSIDEKSNIEIPASFITDILYARANELAEIINEGTSKYNKIYNLPSGIVLTGGGALLKGLPEVINSITGIPTRIGIPVIESSYKGDLENPSFATAYGLLLYAIENEKNKDELIRESAINKMFWKMKSWINKIIN